MSRFLMILAIIVGVLIFHSPATVEAQLEPGKAQVIFHRPDKLKWKATRFNIDQDGRPIGQLLAGTELSVTLDPGTYTFTASATSLDGVDQLTLTVVAGITYRVKGEVLASWPVGRPKFTDVRESGAVSNDSALGASPDAPNPVAAAPMPTGSPPQVSGIESARAGLRGLVGEWDMEMWSLTADGEKIRGVGSVVGSAVDDYSVRLTVNKFLAPGMPNAKGGATVQISLHPERGLSLTSDLRVTDEQLRLTGQFQAGKYVFYLIGGGGESMTGVQRSSVRLEFERVDESNWIVKTYSSVDGRTTQIQSANLTRH